MAAKRLSRRNFIKNSALGAVSLLVVPDFIKNSKIIKPKGAINKMTYEWKFNPRPYSDEEAKSLLKEVVSPETSDWHYNTHHKGYVTFLNNIEKELENADRAKANGNYSQ
ncbi:MAG: twin-arginine translocation signal domain-containing protein, partial [Ignavibacteria bacterium]|nr:twin-arginine translocation signal domain-containing protein [Ignavibacteria bacterium]